MLFAILLPMRTLTLLKDRHYRRYWASLMVSNLGNWMQTAALSWLVLELSASAEALGTMVALRFLPSLLFSLPAGALADASNRRKIIVWTQSLMLFLSMLLALGVSSGQIQYVHVLLIAFAQGTLIALDLPARQVLVVELVSKAHYPQAMSLNSFTFNLSRLIGPALAGVCIAVLGMEWAFWLNALSFLPLVLSVMAMHHLQANTQKGERSGFQEGLRYAWRTPLARQIFMLLAWVSVFGVNFSTLIPAYAKLQLGLEAEGFGFLLSSLGGGALLGSLWQIWSAGARPQRMLRAAVGLGVLHLALAAPLPLWAITALWALCGFCMVTLLININTSLQTLVPDGLRGRVMAVYSMILLGTAPLGAWLTGWLFDQMGGAPVLAVLGLTTLMGVLPLFRFALPVELTEEIPS